MSEGHNIFHSWVLFFQARMTHRENFAASMLALGAMTSLTNLKGILEAAGSFSLPILYGVPMSGKMLAATCTHLVLGGSDKQIYSRYCTEETLINGFHTQLLPRGCIAIVITFEGIFCSDLATFI